MALNIIRYIDGERIDERDLKKFELDNELILKTIKVVNERLKAGVFLNKH